MTGANRVTNVYLVSNGSLLHSLEDGNADKMADLYIRSVCFSPDGKQLATGAEDKIVRVWDLDTGVIKMSLEGHE